MPIGPKGPPQKPGLSIRGRVIFDTVRGVPRVRPWPPKKPTKPGSKRNLTAKAFGAANRACKVTASVFYGEHWAATRGTPLLPRDLMIAMMYGRAFALTLEDGRIIRSMASRNDVSTSLDMIGHTPGTFLVRGPKYWEPSLTPPGALKAMLTWEANSPSKSYSGAGAIDWGSVAYDAGGWTNFASDKQGFIVPPEVFSVRLTFSLNLIGTSASGSFTLSIWKNSTFPYIGSVAASHVMPGTQAYLTVTSPSIPCAPGDRFHAQLYRSHGTVVLGALASSLAIVAD